MVIFQNFATTVATPRKNNGLLAPSKDTANLSDVIHVSCPLLSLPWALYLSPVPLFTTSAEEPSITPESLLLTIPESDVTHVLAPASFPPDAVSKEEAAVEKGGPRSYKSWGLKTACTPRGCGSGQGAAEQMKQMTCVRQTGRENVVRTARRGSDMLSCDAVSPPPVASEKLLILPDLLSSKSVWGVYLTKE